MPDKGHAISACVSPRRTTRTATCQRRTTSASRARRAKSSSANAARLRTRPQPWNGNRRRTTRPNDDRYHSVARSERQPLRRQRAGQRRAGIRRHHRRVRRRVRHRRQRRRGGADVHHLRTHHPAAVSQSLRRVDGARYHPGTRVTLRIDQRLVVIADRHRRSPQSTRTGPHPQPPACPAESHRPTCRDGGLWHR